jgi:hypothetical protein
LRGTSLLRVSLREFTPKTLNSTSLVKKREFRERVLAQVQSIAAVRKLSRGRSLSIVIHFYLYGASEEEGRAKKDIDNLLKIVLDALPDYMDRDHTEPGLGLLEGDSDHPIFEVNATKKLVTDQKEEGIDLEIFEWIDN